MEPTSYGIISLIPITALFIIAYKTKRSFEPVLIATLIAYIIIGKEKFIELEINAMYTQLSDGTMQWLVIAVSLFGGLIALLEKSGGLNGFTRFTLKYATSKKKSLVITWVLGMLLFLDDYLHCLIVGPTMRKITDKYDVSRQELAYIINSNAACVCVIVPISTWAIFFSGLMANSGITVDGSALSAYIKTIPFLFYPIITMLISLLYCLGFVPKIGSLKKYKARVSEMVEEEPALTEEHGSNNRDLINFLVPLVILVIVTILKNNDILYGLLVALIVCMIMYLPKKVMTFSEFMDTFFEGMKNMLVVNIILLFAFVLKGANQELGLAEYLISVVEPFMVGGFLPVVVFIVVAFYVYFTGASWSIAAVMIPIVIPLAIMMDANVYLVAAAVFSADTVGSQLCLISDAVIMNAAATEVESVDHALSSLPYGIIAFVISCGLFLAAGFIF